MLAHLGAVTLPPNVLAKLDAGRPLSPEEGEMVRQVPGISHDLVASIPRLEGVAEAIRCHTIRYDGKEAPVGAPTGDDLPLAARILRLAVDFDNGMAQRPSVQATLAVLESDPGAYDPHLFDALVRCHAVPQEACTRETVVDDLQPGMVIFGDVFTRDGVLLVSRGTVVTEPLILRLENYASQDRVDRRLLVEA
jgi:response regulator RpfG family c-di-GMP phosphodiesterase